MEVNKHRGSPLSLLKKVLLLTMTLLIWTSTPLTVLVNYGITAEASGVRGATKSYTSTSWGTSLVGGAISLDQMAYKVSITRDVGVLNNTYPGNFTHRETYTAHRSPEGTDSFYITPKGYTAKQYLKYEASKGSMDSYDDSSVIFNNDGSNTASNACKKLLSKYSTNGNTTFSSISGGKWKTIAKQCTNGAQVWSYLANSQGNLDTNLRKFVSSYSGNSLPVSQEDDIKRGYIGLMLSTYTMLKNSDQKSRWALAIDDYLSGQDQKTKPVSILVEPAVMMKSAPLGVSAGILPAIDLLEYTTNVGVGNRLSYQGRTPTSSDIPASIKGDTVKMVQYLYKKDLDAYPKEQRIANVLALKSGGQHTNVFSFIMGIPMVKQSRLSAGGQISSANSSNIKFWNTDSDTQEFLDTMTYMGNVKGFITVGYHRDTPPIKPTTPPPKPISFKLDVTPKLEVSPESRQYLIPAGQQFTSLYLDNKIIFRIDESVTSKKNWKALFDAPTKYSKSVDILVEIVRTAKSDRAGNNVQGKGLVAVNNKVVLGTKKSIARDTFMGFVNGEYSLIYEDKIFDNKIYDKETQTYDYQMFITVEVKDPETGKTLTTGKRATNKVKSSHTGVNKIAPSGSSDGGGGVVKNEVPVIYPYLKVDPTETVVDFGGATSGSKPLGKNINIQLRLKSVVSENTKWDKVLKSPYNERVSVYVGMERSTLMEQPLTDKNNLTSSHPVTGLAQIVPGNYKSIAAETWQTLFTDNHYFNFTDNVKDNRINYGEKQSYYYTFSYGAVYNDPKFLTRPVSKSTGIVETEQGVSVFTTSGTPATGEGGNFDVGSIDPRIEVTPTLYKMDSGTQKFGENVPTITIFEDTTSLSHSQSVNAWNSIEKDVTKWGTVDVGITLHREASNLRDTYTHLYPWNKQGQTLKWTWTEFKSFLLGEKTIDMVDTSLATQTLGSDFEREYNYSANITAKVPFTTTTGKTMTALITKNTDTDEIKYYTCLGADSSVELCDTVIDEEPCVDCGPIVVTPPTDVDTVEEVDEVGKLTLETPKKNQLVYAEKLKHDVDINIRDEHDNEGQMFQYENRYKNVNQFKVKIDLTRLEAPTGVQAEKYLSELGNVEQGITLDRDTMLSFFRGETEFRIKDNTYDNTVVASVNQKYTYVADITIEFDYVDEDGATQKITQLYQTNTDYSNFVASNEPAPEKPELIVYNNKQVSYSEIKQDADGQDFGTSANEEFDAMAGVPSNKRLYYAVGGTEFVIDVELEYRQNIWSDWRTYHSYFTQVESQHTQQDRADETQTVPSPSGASSSDLTVTPHGGDLTITATWTGTTPYTGNLAWSDHSQSGADKWDDKPYDTAKQQASDWISAVSAFQLKNQSSSENQMKTWNAWTSEGGLGIKSDSNSHPAGSVSIGHDAVPAVPCSGNPCTGGSPAIPYQATTGKQGTDGKYTITVSATIPAHTVCGPECQYILPQVNDTWKQRVAFDYMKVAKVDIYKLTEGRLTQVDNVFGEGNSVITADIVDGEQQLFHNIAQQNANNIADGKNSAKLEADGSRTWDKSAWSQQGSPVQSSKYGRLRYSLEPLQHEKVEWNEGVRTNKSAGVNDGTTTDGWNGTKYSSAIGQNHANAKGIKYNNNGYTTLYDFHNRECSEQYTSTSDCSTDVDRQTSEWKKFNERRKTKNKATVISDMLILQTSHGDQSIIYFEKDTVEAETQQQWSGLASEYDGQEAKGHVARIYATKQDMWEKNTNSAYTWSENKVNVGSYNGKFAQADSKYDGYNVQDGTVSSTHTGNVTTKFDTVTGDPVQRTRSKSDTQRLEMYNSNSIVPTIPNGEYTFGTSQVFYKSILRFEASNPFVDYTADGSSIAVEPYIYKDYSYKQSNFNSEEGLVYNAPYSDTHTRINNIVIHTPVSTEYAMVISEDADKDQRIDMPEGGASALNDEKNKLRVCPLDPADCQFRVLNCKHTQDSVLADFDFTDVGMYEITNKKTGTGVIYNATNGITFTNGKMNANGTRFSINFADIGLINRRSVTVGVQMDLTMPSSMSGETMIASFDNYGVVYNPTTNRLGFVVDDTNMVRYATTNLKGQTVNIELQMSLGSVLDSEILVNGTKLSMTNTTQFPTDLLGKVGNSLNIGSWKQTTGYPANFTIDNLKVIKKGGTDQHTESCYIYTEEHAESYIHVHTEACYVMDDEGNRKQICNMTGKKVLSENNVHVHDITCLAKMKDLEEIYAKPTPVKQEFSYKGSVETFTAPVSDEYTFEVWGAQGGNVSTTYGGTYQWYNADHNLYLNYSESTGHEWDYCSNHPSYYTGVTSGGSTYTATGGTGGYSKGTISLAKGETVYVYVGGQGATSTTGIGNGGWNGGGSGNYYSGGGGGATDIRKGSTSTSNRVIVAGGGGGAQLMPNTSYRTNGGYGGGTTGGSSNTHGYWSTSYITTGGSQTGSGTGNYWNNSTGTNIGSSYSSSYIGGGGGGYFGGHAGTYHGYSGSGGSGYIGGMTNGQMLAGNQTQPKPTTGTQVGQSGNGYAKIYNQSGIDGGTTGATNGDPQVFNYTGSVQTYVVPTTGTYQLETWGAQGGSVRYSGSEAGDGGKGGYAKGTINLTQGQILYVYVGGTTTSEIGGYNGGGNNTGDITWSNGGGGATHIATRKGLLSNLTSYRNDVKIVAGGGGGGAAQSQGGYGGGLTGGTSVNNKSPGYANATGGGQSSGGTGYSTGTFGQGGIGYNAGGWNSSGGGGGGYFGGGGGTNNASGGGGGSSYVGGLADAQTIQGSQTQPKPTTGTQVGNSGHGVAKITPLNVVEEKASNITENGIGDLTWQEMLGGRSDWAKYIKVEGGTGTAGQVSKFGYTGNVQSFTAPNTGAYTLEVWGAQGGNDPFNPTTVFGGRGGYTKGTVNLTKGETVYIYVGGVGTGSTSSSWGSTGGGGATDIRLVNGTWNNSSGLYSRIIVAGGGGGRHGKNYENSSYLGNDGGGSQAPTYYTNSTNVIGAGQNHGGSSAYSSAVAVGSFGFANSNGMTNSYSQGGWNGGSAGSDGWANGGAGGGWYGGVTTWSAGSGGSGYALTSTSYKPTGYTVSSKYYLTDTQLLAGNQTQPAPNGGNQAGHSGSGYAKITSLTTETKVSLDTIALAKIINTLPNEINGKINPLFVKDLMNYNKHEHTDACTVVKVLACTEPHHDGGHYDGSNSICWDACGNDEWHKQTAEAEIVQPNGETDTVRMADFLNIDEEFTIYFPNKGNFEQAPTMLGVGQTTTTRGKGYENSMDLTQYTQRKRVKFPFNVTYGGKLYTSQTWIELDLLEEYFDFRLVLANNEASAAQIEFDVIAINAQSPDSPVNDNDVAENNQERNSVLSARHGGIKQVYMDVVGRIGNFAITDTEDLRFANLFKETANDGTFLIEGVVPNVNTKLQRKYYGDTVDVRGVPIDETGVRLNTYGHVKYLEKEPLTYPINANDHAKVGNNEVLHEQFLKPGYDVLGEIQTIGDYQNGTARILPYYYKVNTKTNEIIPLDAYILSDGGYEAVHIYQGADSGTMPTLTDYSVVMDWANETNRRNFGVEESNISSRVAEKLGKLVYGNYISDTGLTVYGATALEKMELPIGNYTTMGNAQRIVLNGYMRTFIGSNLTYGVNQNPDDTNGNGIQDEDENWRLDDFLWQGEAQRWHMKMGLPSSTIFVEHGVTPNEASIEAIKNTEGVVLMTADIIVMGNLYTLRYSQPGLTEFTVKVGGLAKTFNVANLGLPPVIGLMDASLTASSDVSVQATH